MILKFILKFIIIHLLLKILGCFGPPKKSLHHIQLKLSDVTTPFYSALVETSNKIKHRYFFPGHCGGRYFPKQFTMDLSLDLPELESIDSIHKPEVIPSFSFIM
jgi:hypothetical protein